MEDLDLPRNRPGMDGLILDTLTALGLVGDEPVQYQSARAHRYAEAFARLQAAGHVYRCTCTRSEIRGSYPGTCRDAGHPPEAPGAWRLRLPGRELWRFEDRFQGAVSYTSSQVGDPVLIRRDGIVAYQFAVVVDDLSQRITDVVRGADLLDSTPWQIAIAEALGAAPPRFAHVPVIVESDGAKLAKSRRSLPLESLEPLQALQLALGLLSQPLPAGNTGSAAALLDHAQRHWDPAAFAGRRRLPLT